MEAPDCSEFSRAKSEKLEVSPKRDRDCGLDALDESVPCWVLNKLPDTFALRLEEAGSPAVESIG